MPHISYSLPNELWGHVFSFTSPQTLLSLQAVDRLFYHISSLDSCWKPWVPNTSLHHHKSFFQKSYTELSQGLSHSSPAPYPTLFTQVFCARTGPIATCFAKTKQQTIRQQCLRLVLAHGLRTPLAFSRGLIHLDLKFSTFLSRTSFFTHTPQAEAALIHHIRSEKNLSIQHLCVDLRNKPKVIEAALANNGLAIKHLRKTHQKNPDYAKQAVSQNGLALKYVDPTMQDHFEVVMQAVSQNPFALEFASLRLRDHVLVVQKAVCVDGWALRYASQRLQTDVQIVKEAVATNGMAIQFSDTTNQSCMETMRIAVTQCGYSLQFASPALRAHKTLIELATTNEPKAIRYAIY